MGIDPITKEERETVKGDEIPLRFMLNNPKPVVDILFDVIAAYEAALAAAEADLWALRKALAPFVYEFELNIFPASDDHRPFRDSNLTIAHFRAARAAFVKGKCDDKD